ncbi:MAG: helix-turn-helix transcriptional regulator [Clostridia bacterium]|nr:helix-turn-helix transcriptional regulator [Clostridia bacterium]
MTEEQNNVWEKAQNNMIANIKNSGISLSQLAKMADISITTLRNILNKKVVIRTPTMIKISKALNMTVDEFVGRKYLYLTITEK